MSSRSGVKGIVINTAERAISTDINRLQQLSTAGMLELARLLYDVPAGTDDAQAGGLGGLTGVFATTAPLTGEIVSGLCPFPVNGTLQLGVTPGLALVINPDVPASTDDSPYKYVRDNGVPVTLPSLVMVSNSGLDVVIAVIECQRVDDPNFETTSRDVFNPTTGLFTATNLQKTAASIMSYRVRYGTAGNGFPGVAAGWLPLTVAVQPTDSSLGHTGTCDDYTFWDVRPLLNDRIFGSSHTGVDLPRRTKLLYSSNLGTGSQHIVNGVAEVSGGTRRVGGQLRTGSVSTPAASPPNVDGPSIDFSAAANQDPNLSISGGTTKLAYYYLCTPFNLPRWARYGDYTTAAALRYPRSPRGIPVISTVEPGHVYGIPIAPVTLPTALGFNGAQTFEAVCFGATTAQWGVLNSQVTSDGWTTPALPVAVVSTLQAQGAASGTASLPAASISISSVSWGTFAPNGGTLTVDGNEITYAAFASNTFTGCTGGTGAIAVGDPIGALQGSLALQENVHFPAGATRLRLMMRAQVNISQTGVAFNFDVTPTLSFSEVGNEQSQYEQVQLANFPLNGYVAESGFLGVYWVFEVNVPNHYPGLQTGNTWDLTYAFPNTTLAGAASTPLVYKEIELQVVGWKFE